ncbi:MAG TPA: hemerythrin domain-containing protein [Candidatus Dormibacteraeota bacterium]|nr:hemerythrin domain-containing protein [Candidatus Dormibacteraeota bacterium]
MPAPAPAAIAVGPAARWADLGPPPGGPRVLFENDAVRVVLIVLEPGRSLPVHAPQATLALAVLDGTGELLVGTTTHSVRAGDVAVVPAGVRRGLRPTGARLLALGTVTPPPTAADHAPPPEGAAWPASPAGADLAALIHREHLPLAGPIAALATLAARLPSLDPPSAAGEMRAAGRFLRRELLPHAAAEERWLYPAVERVQRAVGGSTGPMLREHARIRELAAEIDRLGAGPLDAEGRAAAQHALYGLETMLRTHLGTEEAEYLPHLQRLGPTERDALLQALTGAHAGTDGGAAAPTATADTVPTD